MVLCSYHCTSDEEKKRSFELDPCGPVLIGYSWILCGSQVFQVRLIRRLAQAGKAKEFPGLPGSREVLAPRYREIWPQGTRLLCFGAGCMLAALCFLHTSLPVAPSSPQGWNPRTNQRKPACGFGEAGLCTLLFSPVSCPGDSRTSRFVCIRPPPNPRVSPFYCS